MIAMRFAARAIIDAPGRTSYLVLVLALATIAWITLSVLAAPFVPTRDAGNRMRVTLAVNNANSGQPLPLRYAKRIETIPGVNGVVYSTVLVVTCKDNAPAVSIQAFGGSLQGVLNIPIWPPASQELDSLQKKWLADPMAILVGARAAKDCGWRAGMGVSPRNFFTSRPIEMHVAGVLPQQEDPIGNIVSLGHYDYFNRAAAVPGRDDSVGEIIVYPRDLGDVNVVAARIEEALAHDDPPIQTNTESMLQNALARYGQAQYVLGYVMLATFLCAGLVLISVLAHAIAQRRAQMAIVQVLGFSRGVLLRAFVLENFFIVISGAGLGVACSLLLLHLLPAEMGLFFGNFTIPEWTWLGLPIWLAAVSIAALIVPAITIAALRPVDVRVA
ncbi:MAG: hypothetical protein KF903_01725 [Dokdonella sp.]|uniref:ABC transporter permease n=1 Tax=Dokdonella sp. TaxID=2291710 RepID=UPI0025BE0AC6|nr:ABC transporter permease [Dokdonella sp.]MBX3699712.1 hypothetical protein [Dokdonella sp.]